MTRRLLAAAFAVLTVAACAPEAGASPSRAYSAATARSLNAIAGQAGGSVGIVVADARTGQELYAHHPAAPKTLASNTKLFITAAAANRWGDRISPDLGRILLPSDNARSVALARRLGGGSAARGVSRAEKFAASIGADVNLRDGSGLATGNRAAPRQVVRFLVAMRRVYGHRGWERAFPVAGRSGTLASRMRGTAAQGRCHAKTGTLFLRINASTLSGYCKTRSGRHIAFSMLMNHGDLNHARAAQDQLLARLAAN